MKEPTLYDCPSCGTTGVLPMSENRCPNCKAELINAALTQSIPSDTRKEVSVRCGKCKNIFTPDLKTNRPWICPMCNTKNPNLKRHYRSVANVCILGLIFEVLLIVAVFRNSELSIGFFLGILQCMLLISVITFIYSSKMPWMDPTLKAIIWLFFGITGLSNIIFLRMVFPPIALSALIAYLIVFLYLAWLAIKTHKCSVS